MTTILLTGESGAGKTSVARAVAHRLVSHAGTTANPRHVFGVISLRQVNEFGVRMGILAWLCPSDRCEELAVVESHDRDHRTWVSGSSGDGGHGRGITPATSAGSEEPEDLPVAIEECADYLRIGPWRFFRAAFGAVNEHLLRESATTRPGTGSIALIDEVGPIELRRYDGLVTGVEAVVDTCASLIIVVRPRLVEELARWISERSPIRSTWGIQVIRVPDPSEIVHTVDRILGILESL